MTPTPQSLDTVTDALEAAAKVARDVGLAQTRGWGETGPREAHVAASNTTHAIETAIRALAIKPTPAVSGEEELRKALEPFAAFAARYDKPTGYGNPVPDTARVSWIADDSGDELTVGDLRRARAALKQGRDRG